MNKNSIAALMSVDENLVCSFQILKPADKSKGKKVNSHSGLV